MTKKNEETTEKSNEISKIDNTEKKNEKTSQLSDAAIKNVMSEIGDLTDEDNEEDVITIDSNSENIDTLFLSFCSSSSLTILYKSSLIIISSTLLFSIFFLV